MISNNNGNCARLTFGEIVYDSVLDMVIQFASDLPDDMQCNPYILRRCNECGVLIDYWILCDRARNDKRVTRWCIDNGKLGHVDDLAIGMQCDTGIDKGVNYTYATLLPDVRSAIFSDHDAEIAACDMNMDTLYDNLCSAISYDNTDYGACEIDDDADCAFRCDTIAVTETNTDTDTNTETNTETDTDTNYEIISADDNDIEFVIV